MKPGTEVTVTFLPALTPTPDARAVAVEVFERQTGTRPTSFLHDEDTGVWGFFNADAVLLFQTPKTPTPTPTPTPT